MDFQLSDIFFDYTLRTVAAGAGALGLVSGALGSFAVLRKQSLLGDAISHAALPGIALAFLLTGSKAPLVLVAGAGLAGWLGTLLIISIVRTTRIKEDSALGLVLSVFFGLGLVLLTFIQKMPDASQAGLDKFLFGQAATLLARDVVVIVALGAIGFAVMMLFWKEFKLISFDADYAASLGLSVRRIDVLLTSMIVLAIVTGLQTVGVVLMSAMIVAPAAAARQWTNRLGLMVALAALFGAAAGVSGAVVSSTAARLPTGPMIVVSLSVIVAFSFAFARERGIVWRTLRERRSRAMLHSEKLLEDLYLLAAQHKDLEHGHSQRVLETMSGASSEAMRRSLAQLAEQGFVEQKEGKDVWGLTQAGVREVKQNRDR
jgi:manganese/zinc/iron transport system permease protein